MRILIIRHGDAVDDSGGLGDGARWLSGKGRKVTRHVANWLAERDDHRPIALWTSPLVRAVQTAEIVAEACGLTDDVSVCGALATSGDPREVLRLLAEHKGGGPLALVGHEPSLSTLAVGLLGNVRWPGFKKSGVLCVKWKGSDPAEFVFLLNPKDLSAVTDVDKIA